MRYDTIDSPAGPVRFWTDGDHLERIELGTTLAERVASETTPAAGGGSSTPLSREAARQLDAYFRGRRTGFDLPYRLGKPGFTAAVLEQVARIPYGDFLSYGEVAAAAGNPRAARAAGQAVGANPLPILIPCHRVLTTGGGLGGFGCGLEVKRVLLNLEGIRWRRASPA